MRFEKVLYKLLVLVIRNRFSIYEVDKSANGILGYYAIRGREQQLIDSKGGIGAKGLLNQRRAVGKFNPYGILFHEASNFRFGKLARYSGY